jgi:hypothetical protein
LERQFDLLVAHSGLEVIFQAEDPYQADGKPCSRFMRDEVLRTGVLRVYTGGSFGLPISYAHNLLFRAVHDAQHISTGGSFSFDGECWTALPLLWAARGRRAVQQVLFSEMVMQAAWYKVTGDYMQPQRVYAGAWERELEDLGVWEV